MAQDNNNSYRQGMGMQSRMEQRMRLSAVQIQAMEILQLQRQELITLIKQELEENPTLEAENDVSNQEERLPEEAVSEGTERKEVIDTIDDSRDEMPGVRSSKSYYGMPDAKSEAIDNTASPTISLQDYLYAQLSTMNITEAERLIGEQIIYNINDEGYLKVPVEEIAQSMSIQPDAVINVLNIIHKFDPPGIGATSLEECLLLQLHDDDPNMELKKTLISQHLKDIEGNRIPQLAKKLKLSLDEINELVAQIQHLSPHPGADFAVNTVPYIAPDVIVREIDGAYEIVVENAYLPRLRISEYYLLMAQQNSGDKTAREFARNKIEAAKRLINAITMRERTMRRITQAIVNIQQDFFKSGIAHLKSLKMDDVAKKLGLHVSTISRAISQKYIQTPQGMFRMKFFFSTAAETASGEHFAQHLALTALNEIIANEDKQDPLNDIGILELIKARGFPLCRRTIAKYRKMLKIPPADKRKVF